MKEHRLRIHVCGQPLLLSSLFCLKLFLSCLHCLSFSSSSSMSSAIFVRAAASFALFLFLSSLILSLSACSLSFFSCFWNSASSASLLILSRFSDFLLSSSSFLSRSCCSLHFFSPSSFHRSPPSVPSLQPGHASSPFSLQWVHFSALNSPVKVFLTLSLVPLHLRQGMNP